MPILDLYQKHKKLVVISVIGLAGLLTVGMVIRARSGEAKYLTAAVQRGDITAVVQATGTINPLTTVPVGSYVSGTVQYVFADFNTRVHAGQVLAQLDPAVYEAQVMQARGNLANAVANVSNLEAGVAAMKAAILTNQANLGKAQATASYTRTNAKRVSHLFEQGILAQDQNDLTQATLAETEAQARASEGQLKQSEAQLAQTRAQHEQARAQVQQMTGALKAAETNLRYTTILSPIDGTIVARNITVGQSVAASLQAPVVFSIAQDLERMQVFAKVDESDTGSIVIGADATFQVDAFPTEVFKGRVSAIRLNASMVQNVVTYDTVINFENPQQKLLPGETAYVTIPTGHAADTLRIPNPALRFTPDMPRPDLQKLYSRFHIPAQAATSHLGGWQVVWKLDARKKLEPVAVRAGITDYSFSQLIEGNLKEGDPLITGEELARAAPQTPGQFPGGPRFGGPRR